MGSNSYGRELHTACRLNGVIAPRIPKIQRFREKFTGTSTLPAEGIPATVRG